jgi:hypothetical protein
MILLIVELFLDFLIVCCNEVVEAHGGPSEVSDTESGRQGATGEQQRRAARCIEERKAYVRPGTDPEAGTRHTRSYSVMLLADNTART